jgi:hypothetical protein
LKYPYSVVRIPYIVDRTCPYYLLLALATFA